MVEKHERKVTFMVCYGESFRIRAAETPFEKEQQWDASEQNKADKSQLARNCFGQIRTNKI